MSTRWRLHLEYDGRPFAGWQWQPNAPTIQAAVEAALEQLLGAFTRVEAAGRTDTGVSAEMQIVCFDTDASRSARSIRDGLNAHLPPTIACVDAVEVEPGFDPRRAPHTKTYRYSWLVRPARSPLRAGRVYQVRPPLDAGAMHRAAQVVVGTHDLSSFRAEGCTATHPIRTVVSAVVQPHGDEVTLRIRGTGFLRHTVRILAGTLREVGRGKRPPEWVAEVLAARDRARAGPTAPAEGLVLEHIDYELPWRVAAGLEPPRSG
ncbi:MAG: tRNA pseudouridine(38-40) synthase TruA [Myxococcota bacterium]